MQSARRVSGTQDQAQQQSAQRAEERIRRRTEANLAYYRDNPEQISRRLDELDSEWDLERALAAGASGVTLASLLFTVLRGGKWLLLGLGVQALVMQHARGRRSAPIDLLRNLGLRTRQEIEAERGELESMLSDAGGPDEQGSGQQDTGDAEDSENEGGSGRDSKSRERQASGRGDRSS